MSGLFPMDRAIELLITMNNNLVAASENINKNHSFINKKLSTIDKSLIETSDYLSEVCEYLDENQDFMNVKLDELVKINKILAKHKITGEITQAESDYINDIDI
jgi:hypothetical protein